MVKFLTNANWWPHFFLVSNKCMWRHLLTKFASYKVPPVMVSTHGSVVPLAMFNPFLETFSNFPKDHWLTPHFGKILIFKKYKMKALVLIFPPNWSFFLRYFSGESLSFLTKGTFHFKLNVYMFNMFYTFYIFYMFLFYTCMYVYMFNVSQVLQFSLGILSF